jgi:hypothetical protein
VSSAQNTRTKNEVLDLQEQIHFARKRTEMKKKSEKLALEVRKRDLKE